jgi:hypothetical protein
MDKPDVFLFDLVRPSRGNVVFYEVEKIPSVVQESSVAPIDFVIRHSIIPLLYAMPAAIAIALLTQITAYA